MEVVATSAENSPFIVVVCANVCSHHIANTISVAASDDNDR